MLRWWWTKLHAFIPGLRNETLILFQALSLHQNGLAFVQNENLNQKLETHFWPLTNMLQHIKIDKNNNFSNVDVLSLCSSIVELSWPPLKGRFWFGSEEWGVRSGGIQREIRGSGWQNGRRHQRQVQCCNNALSLQAVVMPEIDWEGEAVIHS